LIVDTDPVWGKDEGAGPIGERSPAEPCGVPSLVAEHEVVLQWLSTLVTHFLWIFMISQALSGMLVRIMRNALDSVRVLQRTGSYHLV